MARLATVALAVNLWREEWERTPTAATESRVKSPVNSYASERSSFSQAWCRKESKVRRDVWDEIWIECEATAEIVTPTQLFYECNNEFNGLEISLQIVGEWWKKKKEGQVECSELAYGSSFQGIPTQSSNESGHWNRTLLSILLFRIWIARTWPIHCFISGERCEWHLCSELWLDWSHRPKK